MSNQGAVASEWVVDGETNLNNALASEFVYGGAWGFEQFYGFGFEISGDAAAAIQQIMGDVDPERSRRRQAPNDAPNATDATTWLIAPEPNDRAGETARLSDEDAKRRMRAPARSCSRACASGGRREDARGGDGDARTPAPAKRAPARSSAAGERRVERRRRRRDDADSDRSPTRVEFETGEDVGAITSNWFDSFPAALPQSIRDRLLVQLEEFVLDPQVSVSLEIALALVGVVERASSARRRGRDHVHVRGGPAASARRRGRRGGCRARQAVLGRASAGVAVSSSSWTRPRSRRRDRHRGRGQRAVDADLARVEANGTAQVTAQGDAAAGSPATPPKIAAAHARRAVHESRHRVRAHVHGRARARRRAASAPSRWARRAPARGGYLGRTTTSAARTTTMSRSAPSRGTYAVALGP